MNWCTFSASDALAFQSTRMHAERVPFTLQAAMPCTRFASMIWTHCTWTLLRRSLTALPATKSESV